MNYPQDFINKIINDDCLKVLKEIPDKCMDYIIADFPYNISNKSNSITKKGNDFVQGNFGKWDVWNNMEDYLKWVFVICKEMQRISKPLASLLLFFDNKQAGWISYELERKGILVYKSPIIWIKNNPIPHLRKTGFRSSFEHAVWMINSQEKYIGNAKAVIKPKTFNFLEQQEMMNVMKYTIGRKDTEHPTEKPLNLTKRFIEIFTDKNDIILDPFVGSGTTAVACKLLNRQFIGIEKEEKYCKIAEDRLKKTIDTNKTNLGNFLK